MLNGGSFEAGDGEIMKAIICDVEHGFCALLLANNGKVMMIDAGTNTTTGFRPSALLKEMNFKTIEYLVISNYDEDHLTDLPYMHGNNRTISINKFRVNKSISVEQLKSLKLENGQLGNGMKALLDLRSGSRPSPEKPDLDDIEYRIFENNYPLFKDTNNLSLLTFVQTKNLTFCFPGDMEQSGWIEILKNKIVQECLEQTNIFVAAHHGRQNGFLKDVFSYAKPKIIIVSDGPIQYNTQEVDYGNYASGISVGGTVRKVLTTRKDGSICIEDSGIIPATIGATKWDQNYIFK